MTVKTITKMEVEEPNDSARVADNVSTVRVGRVVVSPELMLSMFGLGGDHCLLCVKEDTDIHGTQSVVFLISGPMMPVCDIASFAPNVCLTYSTENMNVESSQP
jgi:hypothetical protein